MTEVGSGHVTFSKKGVSSPIVVSYELLGQIKSPPKKRRVQEDNKTPTISKRYLAKNALRHMVGDHFIFGEVFTPRIIEFCGVPAIISLDETENFFKIDPHYPQRKKRVASA